jgi:hypothetical protein
MNRPTAGKRSDKDLPVGEHEIQLYSLGTPNGQKVTILLEEIYDLKGAEYDAWKISIQDLEQFTSGFVAANPNSKIPVLIDRSFDPPLRVFETGSILKYVAEKFAAFVPDDIRSRTEVYNWLFWIHGAAPFLGGGAWVIRSLFNFTSPSSLSLFLSLSLSLSLSIRSLGLLSISAAVICRVTADFIPMHRFERPRTICVHQALGISTGMHQ